MKKLSHLKLQVPKPSFNNPYAQIDWIFGERAKICTAEDTKLHYKSASSFYKKFLKETHNYSNNLKKNQEFYIAREWDKIALLKVKQWIEAKNTAGGEYLASYTVNTIISAVRQTMNYAYECGFINSPVINVVLQPGVRETDQRRAYSNDDYDALFGVISPLIRFSKNLLRPYKKIGVGQDPRILNLRGLKYGNKTQLQGWVCGKLSSDGETLISSDDNIRWYFENEMNCCPLRGTPENKKKHNAFFHNAAVYHGGVNNLYRKWGVTVSIDQNVIMPLVVELIAETGLNVESVLSLKRDCLKQSHPLTGLPYLDYYKARSGGEKTLSLDLYDQNSSGELLRLGQKQSQIISNTINIILKLTEPLIKDAKNDDKEYLLLYQSIAKKSLDEIRRINTGVINSWTNQIVEKNNLLNKDGKRLVFTLSRFRSTKFTELIQKGYDFFDIMSIAGHSSITTTLAYIDKLKTTDDFHKTIQRELTIIKNNTEEFKRKPLPIAQNPTAKPGKFVFKGPVCNCKNPYDPPTQIINRKGYRKGDACTLWNMCLQCPNVLITEMNLPKLFAYQSEIKRALSNGIENMPRQGELYKKILSLLTEILTPDVLFSAEKLKRAASDSIGEYEVIDSFIH